MAQKKNPAVDPLRAKAADMRLAQERADRRVRIVVISVVTLVVLGIAGAVGAVIWQQKSEENTARTVDASEVLGVFADGRPIIVNGNGVSAEPDPNLPTLTEYFDYSCHACADVDSILGEDLTTWASQGHYNLELQPVITVDMDYLKPATGASLVVAQKAPDKWIEFHHALLAYFRTQFQSGNGTVVRNMDASWKQIKQIASEVGVPEDVIATFPVNAVGSYLKNSSAAWSGATYEGRDPQKLGTPEFVKDHASVVPLGSTLEATRESFKQLFAIDETSTPTTSIFTEPGATPPAQSGAEESQSGETTTGSD